MLFSNLEKCTSVKILALYFCMRLTRTRLQYEVHARGALWLHFRPSFKTIRLRTKWKKKLKLGAALSSLNGTKRGLPRKSLRTTASRGRRSASFKWWRTKTCSSTNVPKCNFTVRCVTTGDQVCQHVDRWLMLIVCFAFVLVGFSLIATKTSLFPPWNLTDAGVERAKPRGSKQSRL